MGLRCLLGHDFGEPETEREREEEGNEVVVTVREVKTCQTCGERRVVSENKEIKSIEQLKRSAGATDGPTGGEGTTAAATDASATEPAAPDGPTADPGPGADAEEGTEADPGADDSRTVAPESEPKEASVAEIIDDAETETSGDPDEGTADAGGASTGESFEDDDMPVHPAQRGADGAEETGDDGVILDENASDDERGQWADEPEEADEAGTDTAGGPPADASAAADDEDAVIMGGDDGTDADADADAGTGPTGGADTPTTDDELAEPTVPGDEDDTEGEDAVIMGGDAGPDDPAESGDAGRADQGTTPSTEPTESTDATTGGWPDHDVDDQGHDAGAPDAEDADVDFGGGIAPGQRDDAQQRNGAAAGATDTVEDTDQRAGRSGEASGSAGSGGSHRSQQTPSTSLDLEESASEANLEYYCPECGLTRPVSNSSMRAGDICRNCRKGYIEERERQA